MAIENDRSLTDLLERLEHAAEHDTVSMSDILDEFGDRAITPFILLIALLLISPISGIPGVPTLSAVALVILAVQALRGQRRLWLPDFLLRREVAGPRLRKSAHWLRRPAAFVDRHTRPRLRMLATGMMRFLTLLAIMIIPLAWPALELLPMVTSVGALTVFLLAFGLFTRDGLYVLLGYICILITLVPGVYLLT
ncbi:exopolysaccharide biosynthesis protein [Sulfitobacter aestuarii]|uniref:Exopolysaccharide biosynthesis protein n=1 Tax=Sulfitobacter aestuarii TaxID=2161676 RepID=A0ABW5TYE7_9RHOB